jgi:internalin A
MPGSSEAPAEIHVFVSYSHRDEQFRDELMRHLSVLQRQKVIALWNDRRIDAGQEWKNEIDRNLEQAQVVLLLISADFLASDYCWGIEMKRALEQHESGPNARYSRYSPTC